MMRLHPHQLADREGPDDPVDPDAGVGLEVAHPGRGVVSEDPVDPTTVEAEGPEALLELCDIVAAEHGRAAQQRPVAQPETRFYQGIPGLRSAHPVDSEAPPVLERLDGGARRRAEVLGGILGGREAEFAEPRAQVCDRFARVALRQREDAVHP